MLFLLYLRVHTTGHTYSYYDNEVILKTLKRPLVLPNDRTVEVGRQPWRLPGPAPTHTGPPYTGCPGLKIPCCLHFVFYIAN